MLSELSAGCFRNLLELRVDPHPRLNLIVGPNASGKTSFLECIHFLALGKSFRTSRNDHLIALTHDEAWVSAKLIRDPPSAATRVGLSRRRGKTLCRINGNDSQRMADIARLLPLQVLHPESYQLISGGPALRRAFLDRGCFYLDPDFWNVWKRYNLALKQRNAALKTTIDPIILESLERELEVSGSKIHALRDRFLKLLKQRLIDYRRLTPFFPIEIVYMPGWNQDKALHSCLFDARANDARMGFTTQGPHRADFLLKADGRRLSDLCSRSQMKRIAAALLLAQIDLISNAAHADCLLLIDDLASELDQGSREVVMEAIVKGPHQCFLTALPGDDLGAMLAVDHGVFHVEQGHVSVQGSGSFS